mgnify:CR=1 FL=1
MNCDAENYHSNQVVWWNNEMRAKTEDCFKDFDRMERWGWILEGVVKEKDKTQN